MSVDKERPEMGDIKEKEPPVPKNDRVKGIIQLVLVVAFIVGSFVVSGLLQSKPNSTGQKSPGNRALFVDIQAVEPGPYQINFETTGVVEARTSVNIVPQVSGRVVKVNEQFFTGGYFEAGELLFQIDPKDFEFQVQRLKAEVVRASTALDIERAEADAAATEWALVNGRKPPPPLVIRAPQLAEAESSLNAAKAQLADARLDLERTKFTLPFSGRVLSSDLEQGQYLVAGQSYGQVFDVESLEVKTSLKDAQLDWLMNAASSDVVFTATYLGKTVTHDGYLKREAAALDMGTRFAIVSFGFKDEQVDLLPGVFTEVHVTGPTLENITVIPAQALQKEGVVWIVDDSDNTISAVQPDVVYADNQIMAIRGLPRPVNVISSRLSGATDGMRVQINE